MNLFLILNELISLKDDVEFLGLLQLPLVYVRNFIYVVYFIY